MKKVFVTIIFIYLIIRLLPFCATSGLHELSQAVNDSIKLNNPITIEPVDLEIFPPSLGVQFYRDGIIFLADSKNEEKISSGHVSFGTLQAYYASFPDTLGQHFIFSPKPIFQYPCDALTFSSDFGTMYYTKTVGNKQREKIFRAENFMIGENRQMWTYEPGPLSLCREESIYSHPALSIDGSFMIFASDMKESAGGMDLFITRNDEMKWSEPKGLGNLINTKDNELFPVLDRNNNLFFSSDRTKGSGGYDIYLCRFNGKDWDFPVRLTNSINTKNDEFAFTIDRLSGNSAFFTSMKRSRNASIQLYRISPKKNLLPQENADLSALLWDMSAPNIDSSEIKLILNQIEAEKMRTDSMEAAMVVSLRRLAEQRKNDSIEAVKLSAQKLDEEKLKVEKHRADSIRASNLASQKNVADRLKAEKLRNDSIAAAKAAEDKLKAERLLAEKRKADSIASAKLTSQKLETEREKALDKRRIDSLKAERLKSEELRAERSRMEKFKADSLAVARNKGNGQIKKDVVYFKVQILSSVKPKGEFEVTIAGVKYKTTQYFYLNEYRYIIGVFSTVAPARELQNKARSSGWPQAFVAAFKNGVRSIDTNLFK